jgi:hypothetical protein
MRARAVRRLRRAAEVIARVLTLGRYVAPTARAREGMGRAADALEALDPHEKQLRDDYGVGRDVP